MEEQTGLTLERIKAELGEFPRALYLDFEAAWEGMSYVVDEERLVAWAETGLKLAQQTVRSWEAAGQYFKASPKVADRLPESYFDKWSESGATLCRESPTLAASYFQASPSTLGRLKPRHVEAWARMGSDLYKGTWKSSTLACKFFDATPGLLRSLSVSELETFVGFLGTLSHRSYDVAVECLVLGQRIFPLLGDDKETFMTLSASLAETSWRQVKGLFDSVKRALPRIDSGQRPRFLALTRRLHASGCQNLPVAILEMSDSLGQLDGEHHSRLLGLAESMLEVSPLAMPEFLKSCPAALERVTITQLDKWYEEGIRVLEHNSDGGLAYFKVESARSQRVLEGLSSSVEFTRIKEVMEMYCRALAGAEVKLAASEELAEKHIGWVSDEAPTTEGATVFVPAQEDRYSTKRENFDLFKVISTHQVGHLEFGSFQFEFERPSTLFPDLRPRLVEEMKGPDPSEDEGASAERGWMTDMQRFFNLFAERHLALDVFTVVEDGRLDARVAFEYPGIKADYRRVQRDALEGRPAIQSLPMREALVEFLVRISLLQLKDLPVPTRHAEEAQKIARIARRVQVAHATVEDAAEATLRIYAILSQVPNEEAALEDWDNVDVPGDETGQDLDTDDDELLMQLMQGMSGESEQAQDEEYSPSEDVDYRGDFKPEMVQMLTELRMQSGDESGQGDGQEITQEMLEEMLQSTAELDLESMEGRPLDSTGTFADNMLKEAGLNLPESPEMGQGPLVHVDEEGGPLDPNEPQTFVYDEWDFRADDYKPNWCIVRQRPMTEGDASYYGRTLSSHGPLADQIKRQFELLVPEMLRKVRKLEDGEEIDIDDVIEAMIDIRTGVGPSEKLYWRRNKVQRDVAVVFLLDTSASTAEAIEDSKRVADDWEPPEDPVEYMVWLRNRRGEGMRRSYKRIIDLEKEAVVLLIHALETIGDVYGIYGFSGYGRENVEFYTIKDIDEAFSERVQGRIDRIAPLHATRMGPAIRHATSKLEALDARTKLLFLISDGRPQDRGYSREGVEKEYAVHDTKMALDEASDKNINAFCLTVDKNGHDYLKTMCADMGYEILDDIYALPQRLLYLYRRLTI